MTPEEMADDQLVGNRTVIACVGMRDGTWEAILSCGHKIVFVTQPPMALIACAQCVQIFLARHKWELKNAAPDR